MTQHVPRRSPPLPTASRIGLALMQWIDTRADRTGDPRHAERIEWFRALPFAAMHLACLGVLWVGISPIALAIAGLVRSLRPVPPQLLASAQGVK